MMVSLERREQKERGRERIELAGLLLDGLFEKLAQLEVHVQVRSGHGPGCLRLLRREDLTLRHPDFN